MAENPATWGPAERVVSKVLDDWDNREPGLCGFTLVRQITYALEQSGLLITVTSDGRTATHE